MKLRYPLLLAIAAVSLIPFPLSAQTDGSNSSYSRFGLGLQNDQSQGYNRSMGGVAQGLRDGSRVNMLNPASYSATDSLTFIFDVGMGLQRSLYAVGGSHQSANNTSFDYVNAAFRVLPGLGMSMGFVPYTSIGYNFSQDHFVMKDDLSNQTVTQNLSYYGNGGLHQAYIGAGWNIWKDLSIGANLSYLWGDINNTVFQSFAENGTTNSSSYSSLTTAYSAELSSWKLDLGAQYQLHLNKKNDLTIGATIGLGHRIGGDAGMMRISQSGDTIQRTSNKAFEIPMTYSLGAAWQHDEKLTVAADLTLEQWGNCVAPRLSNVGTDASSTTYKSATGAYSDRYRFNAGAEYVPARFDRSYLHRINYRAGIYYATPNLKVNGLEGPRELGLTAGLGLPISNRWNGRSILNIGVQWTQRKPSSSALITENIFRINIGLTFNEGWFAKWKFQ
ncbi:MAG: hypothetical protein K6C30_01010 [Bacteroidaceae bacterium]|nr:hypothetical protein [Bacteroidaceae bacterium]